MRRLRTLASQYPDLVSIHKIGKSVKGRDLVFVKMTRSVHQREKGRPMFKFTGNMHGDETLGRQLILYMTEYLAYNYGRDSRVTNLLDNTEIYLLPTLNPDGFAVSREDVGKFCSKPFPSQGPGRPNANGRDLNRNFPKQFDEDLRRMSRDSKQLERGRQPETM